MSTTTLGRVGPTARGRLTSLLRPLAALGLLLATAGATQAQTINVFAYTGGPQTYTVPAGVTRLQVVATGASGSGGEASRPPARGAQVTATLAVTPLEVLTVVVGGRGRPGTGGYNGGGNGGNYSGGGGGGATDLRRAPATALTTDYLPARNALVVAGGGGGGSYDGVGGNGGTPTRGNGTGNDLGQGATQNSAGAGGYSAGSANQGGSGGGLLIDGGGGGGGYYGGGSGGGGYASGSGGGGGSSWATAGATGVSYALASTAGDGTLTITPLAALTITSLAPTPNAKAASASSSVQVTFNQALASSSAGALQVFSAQRGGRRTGATPATVSGSQLTFTPSAYPYQPGEVVSATVTTAAQSTSGGQLATPRVFQFTAATGGSGRGGFGGGSDPAVGSGPNDVVVGDVNGDGYLDLLTANTNSSDVSVRFNNGQGSFGGGSEVPVGNRPFGVGLGDVDGDGDLDLVTANSSGTASVRFNNGQGSFSGGSEVPVGNQPQDVALGDVDGDGDLDLLTANSFPRTANAGTVSVRLNDGQGAFSGTQEVPTNGNPQGIVLGDVDGDGDLDVLVANTNGSNGSSVVVRLNDGQGTFSGSQNVAVGGAYVVAVGDLDADGDLDFVTANGGSTASVRLNNGQGIFSGSQNVAVNGTAYSVALGDVDGDGDLDFVTANSGGIASVRLNLAAPTLYQPQPQQRPRGHAGNGDGH